MYRSSLEPLGEQVNLCWCDEHRISLKKKKSKLKAQTGLLE